MKLLKYNLFRYNKNKYGLKPIKIYQQGGSIMRYHNRMLVPLLVLATVLGEGLINSPEADTLFYLSDYLAAGQEPVDVISGDFNGDCSIDLAAANYASGNISVLLGNGDGTFAEGVDYRTGSAPMSLTAGDLDIAVADGSSGDISVLLGNGDGTFTGAVDYPTGSDSYSITDCDLNGDGVSDLAVANPGTKDISILSGNGDGTFSFFENDSCGASPCSINSDDFDNDGDYDICVANRADVTILTNLAVGPADIEDDPSAYLNRAMLFNYPNPFNPATTIHFNVPKPSPVRITILDVSGRRIRVLLDRYLQSGEFETGWNGKDKSGNDVGSGIYFARIRAGDYQSETKLVLMR